MGLFSGMTLNSLDDVFLAQIEDLYDAEIRLTKALPKMAEAASNAQLKSAFKENLRETEQHVARLERVFRVITPMPQKRVPPLVKARTVLETVSREGAEVDD